MKSSNFAQTNEIRMEKITYRNATQEDAAFVAMAVAEAVGNTLMERMEAGKLTAKDKKLLAQIETACRRIDTLYSWCHAHLATTTEGIPVGALVAYRGEGYLERRARTFSLLSNLITFDTETMDAETKDGEYYLDSLAVLPQWRGMGIARHLLKHAQQEAHRYGRPAILACAPENLGAKRLYESLGFKEEGRMYIFGEDYLRMVSPSGTSS